jgi:hypothetical protein
MRIIRVPVFHEGTFQAIVAAACRAGSCITHRGGCWELIEGGRSFAFYRRAPFTLDWIQDRVEDYEFHFYSQLLHGHVGRDGLLRPHARVSRTASGAYRPWASQGRHPLGIGGLSDDG